MNSHPGKNLQAHCQEVQDIGISIFKHKKNRLEKLEWLEEVATIILKVHDYGKGTTYFQEYLRHPNKCKTSKDKVLKSHALISAWVAFYQVQSSLEDKSIAEKWAVLSWYIVYKHHGDLKNIDEYVLQQGDPNSLKLQLKAWDWAYFGLNANEIEKIYEAIALATGKQGQIMQDAIEDMIEECTLEDYIKVNYIFSVLITADKGCAIYHGQGKHLEALKEHLIGEVSLPTAGIDRYKEKKFKNGIHEVDRRREEVYQEVKEQIAKLDLEKNRILAIHVPTGYGKTLAALNAAWELDARLEHQNKIIYVLPFTSIIEQNYEVIEEILRVNQENIKVNQKHFKVNEKHLKPNQGNAYIDNKLLLKHHYLSEKKYYSEESYTYNIAEYLIENWESKIVVTTFVQFLHSVLSGENKKLKKFHNLSNAIILLDEVQSIPHCYWKLAREVLHTLVKELNSYIILVTATMPLIFNENKAEIVSLVPNKMDYFREIDRIEMQLAYLQQTMEIETFAEILLEDMAVYPEDSFLIVLNTINSSTKLYGLLNEAAQDPKTTELIYLSSNIVPKERLKRIHYIQKRVKEKRVTGEGKRVIVVSTQMVEAGVDIDLDRVYRDLAPLDCIIQTAGRCNRNGIGKKGQVILLILKAGQQNMRYADYVYDQVLLQQTLAILRKQPNQVPEGKLMLLAQQYFESLEQVKSTEESDRILKSISHLKYADAFEGKNAFRLIKEAFGSTDVFIEMDDEAKALYTQYDKIQDIEDRWEKKKGFDSIKAAFLSYVISIPETLYQGKTEDAFSKIGYNELETFYDLEIGFKREKKCKDYFF